MVNWGFCRALGNSMNCAYLTDFVPLFITMQYGDPFPLIRLNDNHGREEAFYDCFRDY